MRSAVKRSSKRSRISRRSSAAAAGIAAAAAAAVAHADGDPDDGIAGIAGVGRCAGVGGYARVGRIVAAPVATPPADPAPSPRVGYMFQKDTLLEWRTVLDNVLIPWEDVFCYGDIDKANNFFRRSGFLPRAMLQGCTRRAVKLDFVTGLLIKATEMAGTVEAAEATETARGLSHRDLGMGRLFEDVRVEVKTEVIPEGGELPSDEELAELEAAERAEQEAEAPEESIELEEILAEVDAAEAAESEAAEVAETESGEAEESETEADAEPEWRADADAALAEE